MRYKALFYAVLLATGVGALVAGSIPTATAEPAAFYSHARAGKTKPMTVKCAAKPKMDPGTGKLLVAGVSCLVNSKRLAPELSWSAKTLDALGGTCGSPFRGTGTTVALNYPQAYIASVNATAAFRYRGRAFTKSLPQLLVQTGSSRLAIMCSKSLPGVNVLTPEKVCKVAFDQNKDVQSPNYSPNWCGRLQYLSTGLATLIPSTDTGTYPYFLEQPTYDQSTNTVSAPMFAVPDPPCIESDMSDQQVTLFGSVYTSKQWTCPDGTIVTVTWFLYLTPDAVAHNPTQPYPSCRAGDFTHQPDPNARVMPTGAFPLGGNMDHLTIPKEWSGNMFAEVDLRYYSLQKVAVDEYADYTWWQTGPGTFNGTINGCPALSALGRGS